MSATPWRALPISPVSKAERTECRNGVYSFGADANDGRAEMRDLLGGKGANLAEMASIGLPVPPGFTITTEVCTDLLRQRQALIRTGSKQQVRDALAPGRAGGRALKFGDAEKPLLVSVRSGARVSMPGMMDTVLNLGLNDETVQGLEKASGDARFAWDSYRRFIQMYGSVVLGVRAPSLRGNHREQRSSTPASTRTRRCPPTIGAGSSANTRTWCKPSAASRSRWTRMSSSGAPSQPCSAAG